MKLRPHRETLAEKVIEAIGKWHRPSIPNNFRDSPPVRFHLTFERGM